VEIKRGTREGNGPQPGPSRKREREETSSIQSEERNTKRPRDMPEVILLSSDGDEPVGRRASPLTISSTTDDDVDEEENEVIDSDAEMDFFDDTLVEDALSWKESTDVNPEPSSSSTPDKGKGKEIAKPALDLQEELECFICCIPLLEMTNLAMLMVVPHICSPCGHGACGPCIHKWVEKSMRCPHCRAKLPSTDALVRDYILERITDKYAKTVLSAEELADREHRITYTFPYSTDLVISRRHKERLRKPTKSNQEECPPGPTEQNNSASRFRQPNITSPLNSSSADPVLHNTPQAGLQPVPKPNASIYAGRPKS
jgi:hypothetical protein